MTLTLHLGVLDAPYDAPKKPKKIAKPSTRVRKGAKIKKGDLIGGETQTTGDVAQILEDKYHVMESFYEVHQREIAQQLEKSLTNILEGVLQGVAPLTSNVFGEGEDQIKKAFSKFLSEGEMETLGYPGVPTAASGKTSKRQGGINHRLRKPYSKNNPERPSFIDTGEYEAHFKAWVDGE